MEWTREKTSRLLGKFFLVIPYSRFDILWCVHCTVLRFEFSSAVSTCTIVIIRIYNYNYYNYYLTNKYSAYQYNYSMQCMYSRHGSRILVGGAKPGLWGQKFQGAELQYWGGGAIPRLHPSGSTPVFIAYLV